MGGSAHLLRVRILCPSFPLFLVTLDLQSLLFTFSSCLWPECHLSTSKVLTEALLTSRVSDVCAFRDPRATKWEIASVAQGRIQKQMHDLGQALPFLSLGLPDSLRKGRPSLLGPHLGQLLRDREG